MHIIAPMKLNHGQRQIILAKIRASRGRIAEIDSSIRALQDEKDVEEQACKALKKLLGSNTQRAIINDAAPIVPGSTAKASGKAGGFSEAIQKIIRNSANGVSPSVIRAEAKRMSIPYEGKTKLGVRVQNELFRLRKAGKIRRENGVYTMSN